MKESKFQSNLIKEINRRIPDAIVIKLIETNIQGIPDLLIIWRDFWAFLEVKESRKAKHQPNQNYYIDTLNEIGFASFIFPENKEEVLNDMEQSFQTRWATCVSKPEQLSLGKLLNRETSRRISEACGYSKRD